MFYEAGRALGAFVLARVLVLRRSDSTTRLSPSFARARHSRLSSPSPFTASTTEILEPKVGSRPSSLRLDRTRHGRPRLARWRSGSVNRSSAEGQSLRAPQLLDTGARRA